MKMGYRKNNVWRHLVCVLCRILCLLVLEGPAAAHRSHVAQEVPAAKASR